MDQTQRQQVALFRFQVIAPLLSVVPGGGRLKSAIQELSQRSWTLPFSSRTKVARKTIEQWLYAYQRGGLPALYPTDRDDSGKSRTLSDEVGQAIEEMLRAKPQLSARIVFDELVAQKLIVPGQIKPSTFYRFRKARGLDKRHAQTKTDRRAFTFDNPNDCWQFDTLYGPYLAATDGSRFQSYLYAVLDDATRLICHAQFYMDHCLPQLQDCLKQALLKRGVPKKLYVDNAKVFCSRPLLLSCAELGIQLIHSKPYTPQGRGKVERWFRTVRLQFLSRLDPDALTDLNQLNKLLNAWIEGQYHHAIHSTLQEPPIDKWIRLADSVRPLPPHIDLDRLFFHRCTRRVKKDGTFQLKRKAFDAGVFFIGEIVNVLYDPNDLRRVWVTSESHPEELVVYPLDASANRDLPRADPIEPPSSSYRFQSLENLRRHMDPDDQPPQTPVTP